MSIKLKKNIHYKSVFENEQELLKALINIHLKKDIECDPMFFKGNFYKDGVIEPELKFDLNPQSDFIVKSDARDLPIETESLNNIILDPPFLFEKRKRNTNYYSALTHTIFSSFEELSETYIGILKESMRVLKNNGFLIFKCQDYTDSKTTITHTYVQKWAEQIGFYTKDLAILVKPNKVYNGNTTQRHLRKIHTYFFVFQKKKKRFSGIDGAIKEIVDLCETDGNILSDVTMSNLDFLIEDIYMDARISTQYVNEKES